MRYKYVSAFSVRGISQPTGTDDVVIVEDVGSSVRAVLTSDVDRQCLDGDRGLAVAGLLLRGGLNGDCQTPLVESRIREAVRDLQSARQNEYGAGPFLVIEVQGNVTSFAPQHEREVGGFVVCFDASDKSAIRAAARGPITSIVTAVLASIEGIVDVRKATDAVVFVRGDGKTVYSYSFEAAAGSVYVSSRVSDHQAQTMSRIYAALSANNETARVQRLLRLSSETAAEGLRPFLAAWSALEILINKLFPRYEESLFAMLSRSESPGVENAYFSRVREVMKDKYRLLDKFSVIGMQLAPAAVDEDVEVVRRLKKTRDELLHGEEVEESQLPTAEVRRLALRYLRLHLEGV